MLPVTLHAVSRGRLAPLVGRRFVVVGLRVYFDGIQSLFAFILLMHTIIILFYIAILLVRGTLGIVRMAPFILLPSKKRENEEKSGRMRSVVNSGEDKV